MQIIKIHLIIAYSLSNIFYSGSQLNLFQGLIQGNGSASPGFLLIAIILIRSLYSVNLISHSISLISHCIYQLAGQIFMDDSDFNVMNKGNEDAKTIVERSQKILQVWYQNLQITCG